MYYIYIIFIYITCLFFKLYGLFQIAQSIICHIIGQNNPYWKYRLWLLGWFPVRFCFLERNYAYEMKISVHFIDIYSEPYSAYFLNSMQVSFHVAVSPVWLMLHDFVPALACFIIFTSLRFDRRR